MSHIALKIFGHVKGKCMENKLRAEKEKENGLTFSGQLQ